jgi:hypothetical protein
MSSTFILRRDDLGLRHLTTFYDKLMNNYGVHKTLFLTSVKYSILNDLRHQYRYVFCTVDRVRQQKIPDHAKNIYRMHKMIGSLQILKARIRARHETFNGRLKAYKSLSDTFHVVGPSQTFVLAICITFSIRWTVKCLRLKMK